MTTFRYKARDRFGKAIEGVLDGPDARFVSESLSSQGYIPISIGASHSLDFLTGWLGRRVKTIEVAAFTRQLATLQKAGVPLLTGMGALRDQAKNKAFRALLVDCIKQLESGQSLSNAFARHPRVFSMLYVSIVRSGETSGKLEETLHHLAAMIEFDARTQGRVKSAMMYPALTFSVMICVFIAVVTIVIPRFVAVYGQLGESLPLPTRILIGINMLVRYHWIELLIAGATIGFVIRTLLGIPRILVAWHAAKLRIPVFGKLQFDLAMSRFAAILSELMSSGVPILQALQLVSDTVGNAAIRKAILGVREHVNEGRGMTEPMRASGFFTPMTVQMIGAGEMSGKTDELLRTVAAYYEEEVDTTVKNLTSLIEPFLVVMIGGLVLLLALGVFLPLWNMVYAIH